MSIIEYPAVFVDGLNQDGEGFHDTGKGTLLEDRGRLALLYPSCFGNVPAAGRCCRSREGDEVSSLDPVSYTHLTLPTICSV